MLEASHQTPVADIGDLERLTKVKLLSLVYERCRDGQGQEVEEKEGSKNGEVDDVVAARIGEE
jgi:hypothetical protein